MKWLLELAILVLVARLGSETFRRIRVNPMIGEIVFGFFLAAVLGVVGFHLDHHTVEIYAELGIIFMLFLIGLETELKHILEVGLAALLVGALGVVVPFGMGLGVGHFYGMDNTTSMFLASALMATSVAVTVRVFMDLNYVNNRPSRVVLAAAVIDDILGLLIFSLVLAFSASSPGSFGQKLLSAGGYLLVLLPLAWILLPRLNAWLAKQVGEEGKNLFLIGLLLLIAYLAGISGLAPIIGAFAFGMIINRAKVHSLEGMVKPLYLVLAPVFFLSIGLQMDVQTMGSSLMLGLVLTAVAIVSKGVACFVGAWICRMPPKESLVVGIGMIPRGEVGLIIAGIGRKMEVISHEVFTATAFMCILTVLIIPGPIKWVVDSMSRSQKKPMPSKPPVPDSYPDGAGFSNPGEGPKK